jgi:purine-binding chemotaxis protein CheW
VSGPRLCTFVVGDQLFGVDARRVQEVIQRLAVTRIPLAPPTVLGLSNLRGQIVTCIDLRGRLGLPPRPEWVPPIHIVLDGADGAVSLEVDDVSDVIEIDADSIEPPPTTLRGPAARLVTGAHQLPDRLLLLLDTDRATDLGAEAERS